MKEGPYKPDRGPCRRAFSLVELIVVVGLIALLISMLLPAIRKSREDAQRVTCASQLRQIGMGFIAYANENHGNLPAWSGWHVYPHGSSPYDEPGLGWVEEMAPYLSPTSPVYNCPSFPAPLYTYFIESEWSGVNGRHTMKFTDVKLNSLYIIASECTENSLYPPPYGTLNNPTNDDDRDDFRSPCLVFPDEGGFLMHRGGTNVLFDDIHVAAFTTYDPAEITFHPKKLETWREVQMGGPDES